jgi:hypothetical protein
VPDTLARALQDLVGIPSSQSSAVLLSAVTGRTGPGPPYVAQLAVSNVRFFRKLTGTSPQAMSGRAPEIHHAMTVDALVYIHV